MSNQQVEAIDGERYLTAPKLTENGLQLALTTTTDKTAALAAGLWWIWADTAFHALQGPQATVVAVVATSPGLPANTEIPVYIDGTDNAIAAILAAATSTLYLRRAGPL